jgi:hypothetical protein
MQRFIVSIGAKALVALRASVGEKKTLMMPACTIVGGSLRTTNLHHCRAAANAHDDPLHFGSERHHKSMAIGRPD